MVIKLRLSKRKDIEKFQKVFSRGAEDKAPGTLQFSYFKSPYLAEKLISTCGKRKCYNKNNTNNLKELELLAILPFPVLKTCFYRKKIM